MMRCAGVLPVLLVTLVAMAVWSAPAFAQSPLAPPKPSPWSLEQAVGAPDGLTLSATARLRLDMIDGQPKAGFNDSDTIVDLRTTLFAEYRTGPVRIGVEMFDSRVLNANRRSAVSTNDVDTLEPEQAYLAIDTRIAPDVTATVKLGRMLLNLGARRLVATDEYRNTTQSFTGVLADVTSRSGWRATALYVLPQYRLPDGIDDLLHARPALDRESLDMVLWGALVMRSAAVGPVAVEAGFLHFGEHDRPDLATRDRSLASLGGRVFVPARPGRVDFEVELYHQWGQISASLAPGAPRMAVSAWMAHGDVGYGWAGGWKPRLSLRFDYVSGDRPGGAYGRFDTLFGMRRGELAPAGLYNAVGRANLISPGVRIEVEPDARTDAMLSVRALWLASASDGFSTTGVRDPSGASGDFAGDQLDLRVRRWLVPMALRAELNAVYLAKGRFLRDAPNAPGNGDTVYAAFSLMLFL